MSLTASVLVQILGQYSRPAGRGQKAWSFEIRHPKSFTDGTGTDQVDLLYATPEGGTELLASAFVDLDLNAVLLDAIGDVLPAVKIKTVALYAYSDNPAGSYLTVGAAPANPWQGWFDATIYKERVPPDGVMLHTHPGTGWTVTPATGDILRILNASGAGPAKFDLTILGTTV